MRTRNGFYCRPILNIHATNKASLQASWNQAIAKCQKSLSLTTTWFESKTQRQRDRGLASYPDYYKA